MKKLILVSILLFPLFLKAQDPLAFSKVIKAEGQNKTQLFVAVNNWFAVNYNSANDVIQMADKDAGIIIGKGATDYSLGKFVYVCYDGKLDYTVKVQFKDDRYKVDVSNIVHSVKPGNAQKCSLGLIGVSEPKKNTDKKVWKDITLKAEMLAANIFKSLETKTSPKEAESDW